MLESIINLVLARWRVWGLSTTTQPLRPQVIKGTLLSCGCRRSGGVAGTRKQWITPPTGVHIPYPDLRHCSLELGTHDQTLIFLTCFHFLPFGPVNYRVLSITHNHKQMPLLHKNKNCDIKSIFSLKMCVRWCINVEYKSSVPFCVFHFIFYQSQLVIYLFNFSYKIVWV